MDLDAPAWFLHLEARDDPAVLSTFLPDDVDVTWRTLQRQTHTPLGWAIDCNRERSVKWLLAHGADVEQVVFEDPDGQLR